MTLASSSVGRPNLNIFYFEIVKDKGYSMKSSFIGYVFIETFPCHCAHLTSSLVLQTANTTTKALSFTLCYLLIMVRTKYSPDQKCKTTWEKKKRKKRKQTNKQILKQGSK